jgi:hypothetical protein
MGALFEVQVFRDGMWKIDSVFDDHDLAVEAAQRIAESGRFAARVIEESKDPATGRSVLRAVFRTGRGNSSARQPSAPGERIGDVEQRVRTYVSDARRRRSSIGLTTVAFSLLLVALLVGAGYVAIYFVHDYLNKLMP